MKILGEVAQLSTGKQFPVYRDIVGISMKFTAAEKREIADYMMAVWDSYGNQGDDTD